MAVDISRLSPEHQAFIKSHSKASVQYQKPKKAKAVAYGIEFDSNDEALLAVELEEWKRQGKIDDWRYHPIKVRLAVGCMYTPDFGALHSDTGHWALYEYKGSWKMKNARDSRTRLKIAAELYPWWMWYGVTKEKGVWQFEQISHVKEEAPME
jgi:hypothetical protein